MTEKQHKTIEQAKAEGKYIRKIKSFVLREGRLTNGQAVAIEKYWPAMGLEYTKEPINMEEVFGRQAPTTLEIGVGMGKSLVETAAKNPDTNYIGIEVHRPGVGACLMDAGEQDLTNIRVYQHDGVEVMADSIGSQSLDCIQLFFPDPWHKKRHHKRRIMQADFVQSIREHLKIGGVYHMATDWENYAEHMLEIMQSSEGFENLSTTNDYVERPDTRPLTKFEQRGQRLGHGVWDLMFKRIS
ncbi:MAG: tRNA (guanosine(46)-N7)-methyltransferase TrmB [Psychrosphaera sp.]|nr:tRNA (guanosine(46)-N7)-methyltransferase TrmB [Psychrosphaera sp.]